MISKNANVLIGFLLFSAVLLSSAIFLTIFCSSDTAYADTVLQSREYTLVTAALDESDDLLWVLNNRRSFVSIYRVDRKGGISLIDTLDLSVVFSQQPLGIDDYQPDLDLPEPPLTDEPLDLEDLIDLENDIEDQPLENVPGPTNRRAR